MILPRVSTMIGLAALLSALSACGGPEGAISPVEIAPATPDVEPGSTVQFVAEVYGEPDPTAAWSVVEPDGGKIDPTGSYTAPATEGTYTVVASLSSVSTAETTQVRVKRNVRVDVSPTTATLAAGESLALVASVPGAVKTVSWSIVEAPEGGTVTATGGYTAPQTAGTYHVVATSAADPTKSGTATITVNAALPPPPPPPAPVTIAVSPQTASVIAGNTVQFTGAVTGTTDAGVTWSVAESGGGTVSATGLYAAPATAGTYHVVARSTADTSKTSSAAVTVTAPPAPTPTPTPTPSGVGTGGSYRPSHLTTVTGAGTMPSWATNVVTAPPPSGGDDRVALQAAADSAYSAGKVLVISYSTREYRVSGPVRIRTSVGGVGGMPTIRSISTGWTTAGASVLILPNVANIWVYNLHLVGNYGPVAGQPGHEDAHGIDLDGTTNVTIKGCLIENTLGDGIATSLGAYTDRTATNVLVDGNTIRNPYRNGVAMMRADSWAILNNVIDKQVNYVSGVDMEPSTNDYTRYIEVAYNKFIMNNRTPGTYGSDGKAVSAWQGAQYTSAPGGIFYIHHNYGTFGTGMWMSKISSLGGTGGWTLPIELHSNVEGTSVPTP